MFATGPIAFHTILSLIAIVAGACVILAMSKGRSPGYWTLAFLVTMIATDVTGFLLPAPKLLPSHITGIISLVVHRDRACGALRVSFRRRVARDLRDHAWALRSISTSSCW